MASRPLTSSTAPTPSYPDLRSTIPELTSEVPSLSELCGDLKQQSSWTTIAKYQRQLDSIRFGLQEEGTRYAEIAAQAIIDARDGQTSTRKIMAVLGKVERSTPREGLADVLEDVRDRVAQQVRNAARVKSACSDQRLRLQRLRKQKEDLEKEIKEVVEVSLKEQGKWEGEKGGSMVGAVFTAGTVVGPLYFMRQARQESKKAKSAEEQKSIGRKALGILKRVCRGLDSAIDAVGCHIDFWADVAVRIEHDVEELGSADSLIKANGRIKLAVLEESADLCKQVEEMYKAYSATLANC